MLYGFQTDVSTGKSIKYGELMPAIGRIASSLRKRGFEKGDNVLIMASNHIEVSLMTFSCWKAGGYAACITPNLSAGIEK